MFIDHLKSVSAEGRSLEGTVLSLSPHPLQAGKVVSRHPIKLSGKEMQMWA